MKKLLKDIGMFVFLFFFAGFVCFVKGCMIMFNLM